MNRTTTAMCCAAMAVVGLTSTNVAHADPCGMVPPVYVGNDVPIARLGDQNTYVFFKDGVETFVIHPGFQGKVDEFGMLIPFPAVPELRKVPDNIFPHIRAAIDPPEVVVYAQNFRRRFARNAAVKAPMAATRAGGMMLKQEVRVVKEEAVGMYEVAVLEAGSSAALKLWMKDHDYKFPEGMDKACDDYVDLRWCFVAVKTKVGQKKGADPKPGMRKTSTKMPVGSTFDGHVQAMGFRFRVKELVVPMRLSTFNKGDLHNIVYVLTEDPVKIRSVPEEYVVRQITGEQLLQNVTQPLPLRIIGGTAKDLQPYQKKSLPAQRNPVPKNGSARDLFATDLKAVKQDQLSHPHEEAEKMLLRIGERLTLRGPDIDRLNESALQNQREQIVKESLDSVKGMTLTVIDGNFPREVLQSRNLAFAEYVMPARRNSPEFYDAKTKKPAPQNPRGNLETGAVSSVAPPQRGVGIAIAFGAVLCIGGVFVLGRRGSRGLWMGLLAFSAVTLGGLAIPRIASADDKEQKDYSKLENLDLIDLLGDPKQADQAAEAVIKRGKKIVPDLLGEAYEGNDLALRGWAIVCLAEIGDPSADGRLKELQNDGKQPMLVRTWAAAGRVKIAQSTDELLALAKGIPQFPAIGRPIGLRLVEKLKEKGDKTNAEDILNVTITVPQLQQSLAPAVMAQGAESLVSAMASAKNQQVRRQAAAYLGTLAQQGDKTVAKKVVEKYAFDAQAKDVPWKGGPLFVPGLAWDKENARALVGDLVAWHLWAERNKANNGAAMNALQTQIHNNLRSIQLARVAGYQSPGFRNVSTDQWLTTWGNTIGKDGLEKLLKTQGVENDERYKKILDGLK